jgi:P27 family predicted phage terminase small subunit
MPTPLKTPDRRQRRNVRGLAVMPTELPRPVPAAPAGLLARTTAAWERLWRSPLSSAFLDSDMDALERLFGLKDERQRVVSVARRQRLVEGSKQQPVLSPLLPYIAGLDAEIRALEDRFGLSPRARLQLGVTFGEAHRSLAELNRAFLEDPA